MARVVIVIEDAPGPDLIEVKVDPPNLMDPASGDSPAIRAGQAMAGMAVSMKLMLAVGANIGLCAAGTSAESLFEGK